MNDNRFVYVGVSPNPSGQFSVFDNMQSAKSSGQAFTRVYRGDLDNYLKKVNTAFDPNAPKWKPTTVFFS